MTKLFDELVEIGAKASVEDLDQYYDAVELCDIADQRKKAIRAALNAVLPVLADKMLETPPNAELDGATEWETYVARLFVEVVGYSAPGTAER